MRVWRRRTEDLHPEFEAYFGEPGSTDPPAKTIDTWVDNYGAGQTIRPILKCF